MSDGPPTRTTSRTRRVPLLGLPRGRTGRNAATTGDAPIGRPRQSRRRWAVVTVLLTAGAATGVAGAIGFSQLRQSEREPTASGPSGPETATVAGGSGSGSDRGSILIARFPTGDGSPSHEVILDAIVEAADDEGLARTVGAAVSDVALDSGDEDRALDLGRIMNADVVIWGSPAAGHTTVHVATLHDPAAAVGTGRDDGQLIPPSDPTPPPASTSFLLDDTSTQTGFVARYALALAVLGDGDHATAAELIAAGLDTLDKPARVEGTAEALFQLGWLHQTALDDDPGAIEVYSNALDLDPTLTRALTNRGLARSDAGDTNGALEDFDALIALDPESPVHHINRGDVYANLDDATTAAADYTRALELDPSSSDALGRRGAVHFGSGLFAQADADLKRAIELDPTNSLALYYRGDYELNASAYESARAYYTRALDLEPDNSRYLGRRAAASELLAVDDGPSPYWYFRVAAQSGIVISPIPGERVTGIDLADLNAALDDYTELIRIDPDPDGGPDHYHHSRGRLLHWRAIATGSPADLSSAMSDYQAALEGLDFVDGSGAVPPSAEAGYSAALILFDLAVAEAQLVTADLADSAVNDLRQFIALASPEDLNRDFAQTLLDLMLREENPYR